MGRCWVTSCRDLIDKWGEGGGRERECDKKQGKGKSQSLELDWKEKCGGGMKTGQ